jgi:hypothetical protein
MKGNRSQNTTNGLLDTMESSYVITCFDLHLWASSGYNLVAVKTHANDISKPEFTPHDRTKGTHTTSFLRQKTAKRYRNNRHATFLHPPKQTSAALYTQYFTLCTLNLLG